MNDVFQELLEEAIRSPVCAKCKYAYIHHPAGWGLCKNQKNACGAFPALIDELGTCKLWQPKTR